MRVLHVCTEIYPLLKTGGLADVAGALPPALASLGVDVRMLVPGFPALCEAIGQRQRVAVLPTRFGADAIELTLGMLPNGVSTYLIEAPALYDRPGSPYADGNGVPYADNYRRFALLGWVAAQLAAELDPTWQAQVCHAHDWHAGLCSAYIAAHRRATGQRSAGSLQTIHNLAYQGLYPAEIMSELDLPGDFFGVDGVEFYGHVSFLKAGLYYCDEITTVSPTYAREIQQAEQGCGLQGLLTTRAHDLTGILNGVDTAVWNPATDIEIEVPYSLDCLEGKQQCRTALQQESGLNQQSHAPLFGIVSRLTDQKGLHLVLDGLAELIAKGGQLVVLGSGERELEEAFQQFALAHPNSVAIEVGYNESKAHRLIAGCDVILVPSRFEPCGLTQLYALAYGTLPLVRRVGGLADSVVDCTPENLTKDIATGFVFDDFSLEAFMAALQRTFTLYSEKNTWLALKQCAMRQSFDWQDSAKKLLPIYRRLIS